MQVIAGIIVLGLVLTGFGTWAAAKVDANTERRLLQVQTRQAAAVLSTAILLIQQPLSTSLDVQKVAGPDGDDEAFTTLLTPTVAPGRLFVSASLWRRSGTTNERLVRVGSSQTPAGPEMDAFLQRAFASPTFVVRSLVVGDQNRIGYALADPKTGFAVYAERAIPADRRSPVDNDSAFADLDYAIYLGPAQTDEALSTTDVAPSSLPLTGKTTQVAVPFGDTQLTLVTRPHVHLGASLSQRLPWVLLLGGLLLTFFATWVALQLLRQRRAAEQNAETITDLYERVDVLYGEQRALSVRLQRALLPQANPVVPHLEIAADYVAGAQGIDIGGDWYSMIGTSGDQFAFVVGDVSGRGVDAVAAMAHARFTLRAYLVDGDTPEVALEKCSHQFDIAVDGHMITALVGVGDWRTGEIRLASAGHPPPLLVDGGVATYLDPPVGPPLGTGPSTYASATVAVPDGATVFAFTDGLVERRTESIDTGLVRLARTVEAVAHEQVQDVVDHVVAALRDDDASDDIAVLAFRRVGEP